MRTSSRRVFWLVGLLGLVGGVTLAAATIAAKPAPIASCTAADKVSVESLSLSPVNHALAGQQVTIAVTIRNVCSGPVTAVAWRVTRTVVVAPQSPPATETVLSGTVPNLGAGAIVTVTGQWTAVAGTQSFAGQVDPNHTLEAPAASANNIKLVSGYVVDPAPVATNWPAWGVAAKESARQGATKWLGELKVGGKVNGSVMTFDRGTTLRATNRPYFVEQPMVAAGAPAFVIGAFSDATVAAWQAWIAGYQGLQGPAAFPSFAAFPGPVAPPTPAVPPTQPIRLGSSTNDASMSAATVAAFIKARLGAAATSQPGADAAIDDFASTFNARFTAWRGTALLSNLIGTGAVPTFAPPIVPVGPVKDGSVTGVLGGPAF